MASSSSRSAMASSRRCLEHSWCCAGLFISMFVLQGCNHDDIVNIPGDDADSDAFFPQGQCELAPITESEAKVCLRDGTCWCPNPCAKDPGNGMCILEGNCTCPTRTDSNPPVPPGVNTTSTPAPTPEPINWCPSAPITGQCMRDDYCICKDKCATWPNGQCIMGYCTCPDDYPTTQPPPTPAPHTTFRGEVTSRTTTTSGINWCGSAPLTGQCLKDFSCTCRNPCPNDPITGTCIPGLCTCRNDMPDIPKTTQSPKTNWCGKVPITGNCIKRPDCTCRNMCATNPLTGNCLQGLCTCPEDYPTTTTLTPPPPTPAPSVEWCDEMPITGECIRSFTCYCRKKCGTVPFTDRCAPGPGCTCPENYPKTPAPTPMSTTKRPGPKPVEWCNEMPITGECIKSFTCYCRKVCGNVPFTNTCAPGPGCTCPDDYPKTPAPIPTPSTRPPAPTPAPAVEWCDEMPITGQCIKTFTCYCRKKCGNVPFTDTCAPGPGCTCPADYPTTAAPTPAGSTQPPAPTPTPTPPAPTPAPAVEWCDEMPITGECIKSFTCYCRKKCGNVPFTDTCAPGPGCTCPADYPTNPPAPTRAPAPTHVPASTPPPITSSTVAPTPTPAPSTIEWCDDMPVTGQCIRTLTCYCRKVCGNVPFTNNCAPGPGCHCPDALPKTALAVAHRTRLKRSDESATVSSVALFCFVAGILMVMAGISMHRRRRRAPRVDTHALLL